MATTKFNLKKIGSKTIGLAGGVILAEELPKLLPAGVVISDSIMGAGKIAVGVMLPNLMKKGGDILESVGDGIIASGVLQLAKGTGMIKGATNNTPYVYINNDYSKEMENVSGAGAE